MAAQVACNGLYNVAHCEEAFHVAMVDEYLAGLKEEGEAIRAEFDQETAAGTKEDVRSIERECIILLN